MHPTPRPIVALAFLPLLAGCRSGAPSTAEMNRALAEAQRLRDGQEAFDPVGGGIAPEWYRGPAVIQGSTGTARFARPIREAFDLGRSRRRLEWLDTQYRAPANEDFDLALDRLADELREVGFGEPGSGLSLEVVASEEPVPGWTPRRASLELIEAGSEPVVLHAFDDLDDRDRVMLPIQAPSASVEGDVALTLRDLRPGDVLVTQVPLHQVLERAATNGAAAVVSASLGTYNVDPTGRERHLDAIQYRQLRPGQELPVCQISPRTHERVAAAIQRGSARLRLEAEVVIEERPLRTLIAVVEGRESPERVVAISSHVHEPGANDNGSGVSTLLELARVLAEGIASGEFERPASSIAFVFGDEFEQTRVFLDATEREVVAGISADMTGESYEQTGAIALLERMPDPGAMAVYPPDEHSAWGVGDVDETDLAPNGLAVIARCAMVDVGLVEGGWAAADHPWEGGSDHDVFIERGVPAVLFWHFTDFAYHTSLDRLEMVDVEEMARTGAAILSTALAVADARATDLDRYLRTLDLERRTRVNAAEEAVDPRNAERWKEWCDEARVWLRALCLGIPLDEARPPGLGGAGAGGEGDGSDGAGSQDG